MHVFSIHVLLSGLCDIITANGRSVTSLFQPHSSGTERQGEQHIRGAHTTPAGVNANQGLNHGQHFSVTQIVTSILGFYAWTNERGESKR